jgi:hypothetical protein
MGWMIQGSNPDRGKRFFSSLNHPEGLWGLPSLLFNGYQGSPLGVKLLGHNVDKLTFI